jgi:hypothetical protein
MALKRLVSADFGEAQTIVTIGEKARRPLGKENARLHPAATPGPTSKATEAGAPHEEGAVLNPRLFLTKLSSGRSICEYQADESVYSQGDMADAVFYIESGKVKFVRWSVSYFTTKDPGQPSQTNRQKEMSAAPRARASFRCNRYIPLCGTGS